VPNHRLQGHRLPAVLKRGLAAIAGCGLSLGCLFSHAADQAADQAAEQVPDQIDAPLVDYSSTQLAQLESLDELVPDNLFTIEVILFKRLDTSSALLAQAKDSGSAAETLDNREPLLIAEPRSLPANLFDLSPAAQIDDLDLPLRPATPQFCFGSDSAEPLEPAESPPLQDLIEPPDQGIKATGQPASDLSTAESAPITPIGGENEIFSADATEGALARESFASDTLAPLPEPQFRAVPGNQTKVTPTPYLALIHGVTVFMQGMAHNAFRQVPDEQLALRDLVRRLENSGEFEVLQQLAWQQPVPERGNPQPIYVNLGNGELQGHLAVTLGRYLHTQATLWLEPTPTAPTSDLAGYARLDQSQRMRSGELHYFDHPLFGLLVRIDKVSPPAKLQAHFETFQLGLETETP